MIKRFSPHAPLIIQVAVLSVLVTLILVNYFEPIERGGFNSHIESNKKNEMISGKDKAVLISSIKPIQKDYKVINERPLFEPDRRPFSQKEITVNADKSPSLAMPKPQMIVPGVGAKLPQLMGMMILEGQNVVYIKRNGGGSQVLREGDKINGWIIKKINLKDVILSYDGKDQKVMLNWEEKISGPDSGKLNSPSEVNHSMSLRERLANRLK